MTTIHLTEQQRKYILAFSSAEESCTIIERSRRFHCSKPNAKKMLDRLVRAGMLYKDKKDYFLTEIGQAINRDMRAEGKLIEETLQMLFAMKEEDAKHLALEMLCREDFKFTDFFCAKARLLTKLPEPGKSLSAESLSKILGKGRYPADLTIYRQQTSDRTSVIEQSMASHVFDPKAELVIDKKPHIIFSTRPLKKEHKGYMKHGALRQLVYRREGREVEVPFKNRKASIPLDVFGPWTHLGGGILYVLAWFSSYASINFSGHRAAANYLLVINVCQLE